MRLLPMRVNNIPSRLAGLLVLLFSVHIVALEQGVGIDTARMTQLVRDYNSSRSDCVHGQDGVIVELVAPAPTSARRRVEEKHNTPAAQYLELLKVRLQRMGWHRRLEDALIVHGLFSTVMHGFAAALDETTLALVFNDTSQILAVTANWWDPHRAFTREHTFTHYKRNFLVMRI